MMKEELIAKLDEYKRFVAMAATGVTTAGSQANVVRRTIVEEIESLYAMVERAAEAESEGADLGPKTDPQMGQISMYDDDDDDDELADEA